MIVAPALRHGRSWNPPKGVSPMDERAGRNQTTDVPFPSLPPGMRRADHDGELMNLEDLPREHEGIPHVDLAQDVHRPPSSPQESAALREAAEDSGAISAP